MLENQFYTRLVLNIILGMMFVYALVKTAKNNALKTTCPQKDSIKRGFGWFIRRGFGWLFVILAAILLAFCLLRLNMLKFPRTELAPPITAHTIVRPSSQVLYWGYPNPIQLSILSSILFIFMLLGLAGYCFFSQKSNSSWWKKVLKFIVFLLLFIFMMKATNLYYFDMYELYAPILFFLIWLFLIARCHATSKEQNSVQISNSHIDLKKGSETVDKHENPFNTVSQLLNQPVSDTNTIHKEVNSEGKDGKADTEINSISLSDSEEQLEIKNLHSEPDTTGNQVLDFCPYCNQRLEFQSNFCAHCGHKLSKGN